MPFSNPGLFDDLENRIDNFRIRSTSAKIAFKMVQDVIAFGFWIFVEQLGSHQYKAWDAVTALDCTGF